MKILITGGAGFIGSNLALELQTRGHEVRVLDNLSEQVHGSNPLQSTLFLSVKDKVDFIKGSVTSKDDLSKALDTIDIVVHLAAETGTGQSMYEIKKYSDVNIAWTALLLDMVTNDHSNVSKIVVASSRAVYGEGKYKCQIHGIFFPKGRSNENMKAGFFEPRCPICNKDLSAQPTDEESVLQPTSIYGISKLTQEQMVLTVCKSVGISGIAFRYQNVYGPGQSLSNPYTGILSIFSNRIRHNKGINIFEDGKESRDFVYIDDVVNATASGVEIETPICDPINVGSGVATDVMTITDKLQDLLDNRVETKVTGQFRIGDIRHNFADVNDLEKILNYRPSVTLDTGIKNFIKWVKSESVMNDYYEHSLEQLKSKGLLK
jgi:dTDP-L-rhamnose 4-epimerase